MINKIGIICASDTELEPFLKQIKITKTIDKTMLKFYQSNFLQFELIVVYSGVCKVNAAIATQQLINLFNVDIIINAGTAGGIDESVQLFDTIIIEKAIYHDVADDILTDFHPWLKSNHFNADPSLISLIKSYHQESKYPLLFGISVTGEQFITNKNRTEIKLKYSPLSVDMETASIGHVCYVNEVPFLAIRTITDTNKYQGIENFELNCIKASSISAYIVFEFLTKLATSLLVK